MTTLTLVLFILLVPMCLFLIGLILLQGGAGDISSAFGGGGQLDSTLGVGAGRKMSKITGWLSAIFMGIVLVLSVQHAGDFGHAAGAPAATLSTGEAPSTTLPPVPVSPTPTQLPAVPTSAAPVIPTAPVTAPVDAAAPAPTVPAAPVVPAAPIEKPVAPAPAAVAVPATVVPVAPAPAAPVVPADKPAAATDKPAEQPAAPRSGISLDNQQ